MCVYVYGSNGTRRRVSRAPRVRTVARCVAVRVRAGGRGTGAGPGPNPASGSAGERVTVLVELKRDV